VKITDEREVQEEETSEGRKSKVINEGKKDKIEEKIEDENEEMKPL
jgi:hypothetical protein